MNLDVFPAFTAAQHRRVTEALLRSATRLAIGGEPAATIAWAAFRDLHDAGLAALPPSSNEQPLMVRAAVDGVAFCAVPDPVNGRVRLVGL